MEGYLGDIQPQQMNSLYPQQQPPGQQQQREQLFQQAPKPAIQSQAGASLMAPFPPHQQGGAGGMGSGMSPTGMNPAQMGPGMNPGMNPNMGGPSNMGPGMNPGMNVGNPGGMNPNMAMNGPGMPMNMNGPGMGMGPGQRPGMAGMRKQQMGGQMSMGSMRPAGAGAGPPRMPNGMGPGMPGQGGMGMGGVPGLSQGAMGGLGPGGPGAGGLGPAGAGGMGNMMSMGGAGGMPSQPGMPNNMGPGVGAPGGMGAGGMGMGLNGMGGSGGPGLGGNGMPNGPNRQWQYPDGMKRTTPQLDEFSTPHIASQQHAQHGVGGPQHGVGGPGQMPHALGPQMQPGQAPPQPTAPSPVGGLPAHHPQHPGHPGHMGPGGPGHMQPGGTPRMATPSHPGGPHMPNPPAPSPHHMAGSPVHHPAHPHQPHLAGSPAHQSQMSSPRHMTSSSPAPGPGNRSNAQTPVPPRGASADPMGMRPDAMGRRDMSGEPTMMRMGEGIGPVIRGPDGSLRPENPMMVVRDGRLVGDGMMQPIEGINRTPSADGMGRPPGMTGPPNGMRQPEIGRLGADGMVRGPYGQPPPYGAQTGNFNPSAPPYVLHQTPAQQHQNMQIQRGAGAGGGVPRSGSVDEMPGLPTQMGLADDLDSMNMPPGGPGRPNRQSMPPAMPMMMNGGGPRPMPGMGPVSRRSTLISRPCALGLGVVRMLKMSHDMSQMGGRMMGDWLRFRDEYFTSSGKIAMTIFYNVEGRKYSAWDSTVRSTSWTDSKDAVVSPELIARFFLAIFESGVGKMSLGLLGATESAIHEPGREHYSNVETVSGVWRYELENGWVVEQNGPMKILLVAEPIPGDPQQFKLKIEDLTFTAPTTSFFFRPERLEGNRIQSHGAPMTPRISPGLAARKPEPNGGQGAGGMLEDGGNMEQEEMLMYENVSLPPMPFQKYGFPENVWRLLAMSACVHELGPIMQLEHALQNGPLAALDTYADMDNTARHETGFEFDDLGGQFSNFNAGFNPSAMSNSSPALAHAHPGMHSHPPGSIPTAGRPTPTPPPVRPPGAGGPPGPRLASNGAPLAGSGELPPLPSLAPGIPQGMPGMIMSQSPSLTHPMPPGQPGNAQGIKRKLGGPEQPSDPGAASGSQPPRAGMNHRAAKMPPAGARKKAKPNTVG